MGRQWAHGPREVLEERLRRRGDGGARGGRRLGLQARRRRGERRGAGTADSESGDTSHFECLGVRWVLMYQRRGQTLKRDASRFSY